MSDSTPPRCVYLARKPGSVYRQLFVKGRNIAARTLYGRYRSEEDPMAPEEIAADYGLPLEAVREAIASCQSEPPEIREDWEREEANIQASSRDALGPPSPAASPPKR
jgi:uncharacterized protein (DUF433 family)